MNMNVEPTYENSSSSTNGAEESAVVSSTQQDNITSNNTSDDTDNTMMNVEPTTTSAPLPPPPYLYHANTSTGTSVATTKHTPTPEILQLWVEVGNHIDKSQTGKVMSSLWLIFHRAGIHSHGFSFLFHMICVLTHSGLEECRRIV